MRYYALVVIVLLSLPFFAQSNFTVGSLDLTTSPSREITFSAPHGDGHLIFADDYNIGRLYHLVGTDVSEVYAGPNKRVLDGGAVNAGRILIISELDTDTGHLWLLSSEDNTLIDLEQNIGNLSWHIPINNRQLLVNTEGEIIAVDGTIAGTEIIYSGITDTRPPGKEGHLAFGRQILTAGFDMFLTDGTSAGTDILLSTPNNTQLSSRFIFHLGNLYYNRSGVQLDVYHPDIGEWLRLTSSSSEAQLSPELNGLGRFSKSTEGFYAWGQSQTLRPSFYFTDGTPEGTFRLLDSTGTEEFLSTLKTFTNPDTDFGLLYENLPRTVPYDKLFISEGTPETTFQVDFNGTPWKARYFHKLADVKDGMLILGADSLMQIAYIHRTPDGIETDFVFSGLPTRIFNDDVVNNGDFSYFSYYDIVPGNYTAINSGFAIFNSSTGVLSFSEDEVPFIHSGDEVVALTSTHLFYAAENPNLGTELYAIAHGSSSAQLIADLNPGEDGSFPALVTAGEDSAIIIAYDAQNGNQVISIDGTPSGTQTITDLNDNIGSTSIRQLSPGPDDMYYREHTGELCWVNTMTGETVKQISKSGTTFGYPVNGSILQFDGQVWRMQHISRDAAEIVPLSDESYSNTTDFMGELTVLSGAFTFSLGDAFLTDFNSVNGIDTIFENTTVFTGTPQLVGSGRNLFFLLSDFNTFQDRIFHRSPTGVTELDVDINFSESTKLLLDQSQSYLTIVKRVSLGAQAVVFTPEGEVLHRFEDLSLRAAPETIISLGTGLLLAGTNTLMSASIEADGMVEEFFSVGDDFSLERLTTTSSSLAAFVVTSQIGNGSSLYLTDGTVAGTREVAAFPGNIEIPAWEGMADNGIPRVGPWLSFIVRNADGTSELMLFNATTEEILTVSDPGSYPREVVVKDNRFYFSMYDETIGRELFYLDFAFNRSLDGVVFYDQNGNGVRDEDEPGLVNQRLEIMAPDGAIDYVFTDEEGAYSLFYLDDEEYTIRVLPDDCWEVTTGSDTQLFTGSTSANSPVFGLNLEPASAPAINTFLSSSILRCNTSANVWVHAFNDGCTDLENVTLTLTIENEEVSVITADGNPATDGNVLTWSINTLDVGESREFLVEVELPDEEATGDLIEYIAAATDGVVSDEFTYATPLRCAYDPNDKLVSPARSEETNSNYTQIGETLTYTIRFQNTGNDTAINVRLEDQLDPALDWRTFNPLAASHRHRVFLSDDGLLRVFFDDIFLPDSNVNLLGSNGFFAFEIDLKPEALDRIVSNNAGIYFDSNAPIITNTVTNKVVEFLDEDEDGFFFWEECDDKNPLAYPGADDIFGNGIDENCDGEDGIVSTINPLPGNFTISPNPTSTTVRIEYSLPTELQVDLIDGRGRRVRSMELRSQGRFDVSNLSAALYQLRFIDLSSGRTTVRRLVVE